MIEHLAKNLSSGDGYVEMCRAHLRRNEWGVAYQSILLAMQKGNLSDVENATQLYRETCERMGIRVPMKLVVTGASAKEE